MMVGRVGRMGVTVRDRVVDVNGSDGVMLGRTVGVVIESVGGVTVKGLVIVVDGSIGGVTVKGMLDVKDGGTGDVVVKRVLADDESCDERVVVGTVAIEGKVDDRVLGLPVDGFGATLEEPLLVVILEGIPVLTVLLGDALVDVAEVELWRIEEVALVAVEVTFDVTEVVGATVAVVLGVALLVLWETNFEVEISWAVEVLETLTVASKECQ